MRLIILTQAGGDDIAINPVHVILVIQSPTNVGCCQLRFPEGDVENVRGSLKDVVAALNLRGAG
jgi:hypothetical protein